MKITIFFLSKSLGYTFNGAISFEPFLTYTFGLVISCLTFRIRNITSMPFNDGRKQLSYLLLKFDINFPLLCKYQYQIYLYSWQTFSHNFLPLVSGSMESKHDLSSAHCVSFSQSITPFFTKTNVIWSSRPPPVFAEKVK